MYICEDCSREFDEPEYIREYHYELPESPYETFAVCPYCGGDFSEAEEEEEEE
jgi:DNA-directed RNA polymerase subunit RPC12/RpoP